MGISEIDIGVMVGRFPKVLYFEPEFQIERLRLLRSLLPNVNLRRVIERNPQVLGRAGHISLTFISIHDLFQSMTASVVHVTNLTRPGSDNPRRAYGQNTCN